MIERTLCVSCGSGDFQRYYTHWECKSCRHKYQCIKGIPKLYIEAEIGNADKRLRDIFYNGLLGRFYNLIMPFLSLPARPFQVSLWLWGVYCVIMLYLGFIFFYILQWMIIRRFDGTNWVDGLVSLLFLANIFFLFRYPYIRNLIILAIPVKISLSLKKFQPLKTFNEVHRDFQEEYRDSSNAIKILDVATGSCNSLYRHSWMSLNAEYVGIDLSEKMLLQGADFMTRKNIAIDFAFADAHKLPFETESFDVVTCYGAVNGYTNVSKALNEMVRVTKKGGKILFLDEQLYNAASLLERSYFNSVLSSHDVINYCPIDLLPSNVEEVQVSQVYQFYYICSMRKRRD